MAVLSTPTKLPVLGECKADVVAELRRREQEHAQHEQVVDAVSPGACYVCRGSRFWRSVQSARSPHPAERARLVCGRCHPPPSPELVAEWVDLPEPVAAIPAEADADPWPAGIPRPVVKPGCGCVLCAPEAHGYANQLEAARAICPEAFTSLDRRQTP